MISESPRCIDNGEHLCQRALLLGPAVDIPAYIPYPTLSTYDDNGPVNKDTHLALIPGTVLLSIKHTETPAPSMTMIHRSTCQKKTPDWLSDEQAYQSQEAEECHQTRSQLPVKHNILGAFSAVLIQACRIKVPTLYKEATASDYADI